MNELKPIDIIKMHLWPKNHNSTYKIVLVDNQWEKFEFLSLESYLENSIKNEYIK